MAAATSNYLKAHQVLAETAHWTSIVAPAVLMAVLAAAVWLDFARHRIPNVLTFGALGAGLLLSAVGAGLDGAVTAFAGAAVAFACFMPLYLMKGMGGGDVKLMAAAGAFLGPMNAFIAAMLTLATGAILGLVVLAWRLIELRDASGALLAGPVLAQAGKKRFPYAAAIAVGVVSTMCLRGLLKPLFGGLA